MAADRYENYVSFVVGFTLDQASVSTTFRNVENAGRQMGQALSREVERGARGATAALGRMADEFGRMAFRYTYYAMVIGRVSQYFLGRLMTRPFYQAAKEMDSVRAQLRVLTEDTAQYIDVLTKAAQQLALVLPQTSVDIMKGFITAIRAGRPLEELAELTKAASNLSLISRQALETEVQFISLVRSTYPGVSPEQIGALVAKAATMSPFGAAELEDAMRRALSTMASMGMSLPSGIAQILSFARVGVEPTRAGTMLRRLTMRELQPRIRSWARSAFSYLRTWSYRLQDETSEWFRRLAEGLGGVEEARAIVQDLARMPAAPNYQRPGETTYWTALAARIAQILDPERYWNRIRPGLTEIWGVREVEPFLAVAGFAYETAEGKVLRGIQALRAMEEELGDSEEAWRRILAEYRKSYEWAEAQAKATSSVLRETFGLPMQENLRPLKLFQTAVMGAIVGLISGSDQLMDRWREMGGSWEALSNVLKTSNDRLAQFRVAMIATTVQLTGAFMKVLGIIGLAASTFGLIGVKAVDIAESIVKEGRIPLIGAIPAELLARVRMPSIELPGGATATGRPLSPLGVIWRAVVMKGVGPFKIIATLFASILSLAWVWHADLGRIRSRMDHFIGQLEGIDDIVRAITRTVRSLFAPLTSLFSGLRMGFNAALNMLAWGLRGVVEIIDWTGKMLKRLVDSSFGRVIKAVIGFPLRVFGGVAGFFLGMSFIFWMINQWASMLVRARQWLRTSHFVRWLFSLERFLSAESWERMGKALGKRMDRVLDVFWGVGKGLWGGARSIWAALRVGGIREGVRELRNLASALKTGGLVSLFRLLSDVMRGSVQRFGTILADLFSPLRAFIRGLISSSHWLQMLTTWIRASTLATKARTIWDWIRGFFGRRGPDNTSTTGLLGPLFGRGPFAGWGMWELQWGMKELANTLRTKVLVALERFRAWLWTLIGTRLPIPGLPPGGGGGKGSGPVVMPGGGSIWSRIWSGIKGAGRWLLDKAKWLGRGVWNMAKGIGRWGWNLLKGAIWPVVRTAGSALLSFLTGGAGIPVAMALAGAGLGVGVRFLRRYLDARKRQRLAEAASTPFGIGATPQDARTWIELTKRGVATPSDTVLTTRAAMTTPLSSEELEEYRRIFYAQGEAAARRWLLNYTPTTIENRTEVNVDYHPILQVPEGTTEEQARALLDDVLTIMEQHIRNYQVNQRIEQQRQAGLATVNP